MTFAHRSASFSFSGGKQQRRKVYSFYQAAQTF
jgi:hypothetical protein